MALLRSPVTPGGQLALEAGGGGSGQRHRMDQVGRAGIRLGGRPKEVWVAAKSWALFFRISFLKVVGLIGDTMISPGIQGQSSFFRCSD